LEFTQSTENSRFFVLVYKGALNVRNVYMFSKIFTLLLLLVALKATAQQGNTQRDAAQRGAAQRSAAQRDLIITQAGEQIRCRIVDESSMRFSYIYVNDKGKPVRTEIFKTLISSFKYNYFPEDLPSGKKGNTPVAEAPPREKDRKPLADQPAARKEGIPAADEKKVAAARKDDGTKTVPADEKKVAGARKDNEAENPSAAEKKAAPSAATRKEDLPAVTGNRTPAGKAPAAIMKDSASREYVSPLKGKTEFTNYLKYRVGFKGGLGNIIDENTDKSDWGLYNEKLRRGWIYGVDAAVFLTDHIGLGVTYHSYQSANKNVRLDFPNPGTGEYIRGGSLESKVNHKFVGATLLGRVGMDYKTFIVATVSPGYYFYSDKGTLNQMNYEYKGGIWGGAATLGIDFLLGSNETGRDVILSFECGYNYGQLKSLNYGGTKGWQECPQPIQLNRLDFSVGLRFTRFPRYLR